MSEKLKMINAQTARVPICVNFAWDSGITNTGDIGYWKNNRGEITSSGWYATHSDGSITVRDRLASNWTNYVIPKVAAVYQIPKENVDMFTDGLLVRYVRTEGPLNNYYGVYKVVAIKYLPTRGGGHKYSLYMVYDSMNMDFVNEQALSDQRSKSEYSHLELLNTQFIADFNLMKHPNLSVSVDYERLVLQAPSSYQIDSYTPDFRIIVTKHGYITGRTHVLVESKSGRDGLSGPGVDEKIKLVTDYHNMHMLVMFGSPPKFKYVPKFTCDWKTVNPDMNMDETIQLLLRLTGY
ncbi:hypothetical protein EhV156_00085 [Emiliania huxleyi virus 156]|nr:hypothetical protein EhV156_00085 [Emiliania huxleyi virus 156]